MKIRPVIFADGGLNPGIQDRSPGSLKGLSLSNKMNGIDVVLILRRMTQQGGGGGRLGVHFSMTYLLLIAY